MSGSILRKEGLNGWLVPLGETAQAVREISDYFTLRDEPKKKFGERAGRLWRKTFAKNRLVLRFKTFIKKPLRNILYSKYGIEFRRI